MRKATKAGVIALTAGISIAGLTGCAEVNQKWHENCTVLAKDRPIVDGTEKDKRVATTCGTFKVEDSYSGGYDSYDVWIRIDLGKTYDFKTLGYRNGWFSMFPTVIEVRPA